MFGPLVFILTSALCLSASASQFHVQYFFSEAPFSAPATRQVSFTPLWTVTTSGTNILIGAQRTTKTATNGSVTISNLFSGGYRVEYVGPFSPVTFTNVFGTNIADASLINGKDYISASVAVNGTTTAYSQAQADQRFVRTNETRNVVFDRGLTVGTNTTGYWGGATNGEALVSFRDWTKEPAFNNIEIGVASSTNTHYGTFSAAQTRDSSTWRIETRSNTPLNAVEASVDRTMARILIANQSLNLLTLEPTVPTGGLPYALNTENAILSGHLLTLANQGTNKLTVGYDGTVTATAFSGDGAAITNLNLNVADANNVWTGSNTFSGGLIITDFLRLPTNYVAANFVPTAGVVKIISSNGALYSVTEASTNLIAGP